MAARTRGLRRAELVRELEALGGGEEELTEKAKVRRTEILRELDALKLEELRERIATNPDGTIIVRLQSPVRLGHEEVHRLTVRPVTFADVRRTRGRADEEHADVYLDALVEPKGAADVLASAFDVEAATLAVTEQLGKYLTAGWEPSP